MLLRTADYRCAGKTLREGRHSGFAEACCGRLGWIESHLVFFKESDAAVSMSAGGSVRSLPAT